MTISLPNVWRVSAVRTRLLSDRANDEVTPAQLNIWQFTLSLSMARGHLNMVLRVRFAGVIPRFRDGVSGRRGVLQGVQPHHGHE